MSRTVVASGWFLGALLGWLAAIALHPTAASAWGYEGHRVVGAIADQLLKPAAKAKVQQLLNEGDTDGIDLRKSGPWLDCVKSVVRHDDGRFHYEVDPEHLDYEVPCTPFNSARERGRMVDYPARNWSTCSYKPDGFERGCHNTFHFVDVAIQRGAFDRSFQGTNPNDLVAAISAAIAVLQDKPIPPPFPFSIKDKKEALLLLAHLIGDLHQPLHVGSVYLDPNGQPVDPDVSHQVDPGSDTIGGNAIQDGVAVPFQTINLHHEWDDIPTDLRDAATGELIDAAKAVPASPGTPDGWPAAWATDTLLVAHDAFKGLSFGPTSPPVQSKWIVNFDSHMDYLQAADAIKRRQLAKGGARLAELLNAIWP
ncbi:S1/P1 nuclease [Bradyrhizobium sp. 27S5]|uniref:S1/P1 nuclease n=1 Tax=Bradyrhizobium sp. 27S5 TaxID=3139728 RepID=UPI0030CA886A